MDSGIPIEAKAEAPIPAGKKERVWEIDFLRGAAILGMVVDHFIFDLGNLRNYFVNFDKIAGPKLGSFVTMMNQYFYGPTRQFFHSLAFLFFLMSGISCSFSHNNFRHGGKILLFSGLITIFTYSLYFITNALGDPLDIRILFGVLYVLGMGVLLVAVIQKIPGSKWIELGLGLAILLFGFFYGAFVNFKGEITDWNSFWDHFLFLFDSSPWIGFRAFLGETIYKEKKSLLPKIDGRWHKPVDWFGAKSLYVYALHQPFWLLLLLAVFLPLGFRLV